MTAMRGQPTFTDRDVVSILYGLGNERCTALAAEMERGLERREEEPAPVEVTSKRYVVTRAKALPWVVGVMLVLVVAQWWMPAWFAWLSLTVSAVAAVMSGRWYAHTRRAGALNRQERQRVTTTKNLIHRHVTAPPEPVVQWSQDPARDFERDIRHRDRQAVLDQLRPAEPGEYETWVEGFIRDGGVPNHRSPKTASGYYVAKLPYLRLTPLYGANSLNIIVPKDCTVAYSDTSEPTGHNVLFMFDGRSRHTSFGFHRTRDRDVTHYLGGADD